MKTKFVSIRCRRHKRRFDVPAEWAKSTCDWLCPQCYEKLKANERKKYAPTEKPEIRKPDGIRICLPSRAVVKTTKPKKKPVLQQQKNKRPIEDTLRKQTPVEVKKAEVPKYEVSNTQFSNPFINKDLAFLLPNYRIYCHKCKKEIPCHKSWFDQSTTLCPVCFSNASERERETYERAYGDKARRFVSAKPSMVSTLPKKQLPTAVEKFLSNRPTDPIICDNLETHDISAASIMHMSMPELQNAVKRGIVSKVRANIELKRRKNAKYYNTLPDVMETQFAF